MDKQLNMTLSRLILFDVSGIMCVKTPPGDFLEVNSHYSTVINPHIKDTIDQLSQKYAVGIFSSTKFHNLIKIIHAIFGVKHPFIIIADRSLTQLHPKYGSDPTVQPFDTIKPLDNIWKNSVYNQRRQWNHTNTLLVDHDYRKIDSNPPENILVVPEFTLERYYQKDYPDLVELISSHPILR